MPTIENKSISLSVVAKNLADIGIARDTILEYLVNEGLLTDIRTITEKGLNSGITYFCKEDGAKWPVYDSSVQRQIVDHFNTSGVDVLTPVERLRNQMEKGQISVTFSRTPDDGVFKLFNAMSTTERRAMLESKLQQYYGSEAEFRDGQYEAIEGVLLGKHALVVQKTGWGKSLVYFLSTKVIREHSKRFTLIISPLLALMNNQIDSAAKLDMNVRTINSTNTEEWNSILEAVSRDELDAVIISPERLANEDFIRLLNSGMADHIGMFVVDEAHCISDWGHDFRPDYRRIVNILKVMPNDIPILATTATASDRVVEDIKNQLGDNVVVSRGPLLRSSIAIQTINIDSRERRMAWLAEHINELPGTGVIYCLTVNDCNSVNDWLNKNGIPSKVFTGRTDQTLKEEAIALFEANKIKALVATSAFGMGYDKPDIGFVIHFQKPKDVIAYYQQIGRAGREIDNAYAILLYGESDDEINNYFIENAFPTEAEMEAIVSILAREPGLKKSDLQRLANMTRTKIDGVLTYLEVEGAIKSVDKNYYLTDDGWKPDLEKSQKITERRYRELEQMNIFAKTDKCYMQFLANALDDSMAHNCGKCSNCLKRDIIDIHTDSRKENDAEQFVENEVNVFVSRKQWPHKSCSEEGRLNINNSYQVQDGMILCTHTDTKLGQMIHKQKFEDGMFDETILEASYKYLEGFIKEKEIKNITFVPSLNYPGLLPDFTRRLADRFGLNYYEGIEKIDEGDDPGTLNNSYLQWQNANDYYDVIEVREGNTLLVDDTFRSKWTITCCGYKLLKMGNGPVYPFVLLETASAAERKHDLLR